MMVTPDWLAVAQELCDRGIQESPGSDHNWEIVRFFKSTTYHATEDEIPWCSAFACHCLETAGFVSPRSAAARSYLTWGTSLVSPAYGCLGVFKHHGGPGPEVTHAPGHVGFIVGYASLDSFLLLGGNQSDAVNIQAAPVEDLLGLRWPSQFQTPVAGA